MASATSCTGPLNTCPSVLSAALIKYSSKPTWGEILNTTLLGTSSSLREDRAGTQGGSPETGTEAETAEETCSQACLLGLAQPLIQPCLAITQVTVDWTLPHHLAIQKECFRDIPTG